MTEIDTADRDNDPKAIAPGNLERVRQFINTLNIEADTDQLGTIESAQRWFIEAGFIDDQITLTDQDLQHVHNIREALRNLTLANNHGDPDQDTLEVLNRAAQNAPLYLSFVSNTQAQLQSERTHLHGFVATLFAIIYEEMQAGTWHRLKTCQNDECLWVFYDHSKNRSGKWCSMAICGSRMKVRAFRARQNRSDDQD